MHIYTLTSQPFLDQQNECYKNIITVNQKPEGPLANITRRIHAPKLSPFKENSSCCPQNNCIYGITKIDNPMELMCISDLPNLFTFLSNNGYVVDTSMTKMMNESKVQMDNSLLCFISYL